MRDQTLSFIRSYRRRGPAGEGTGYSEDLFRQAREVFDGLVGLDSKQLPLGRHLLASLAAAIRRETPPEQTPPLILTLAKQLGIPWYELSLHSVFEVFEEAVDRATRMGHGLFLIKGAVLNLLSTPLNPPTLISSACDHSEEIHRLFETNPKQEIERIVELTCESLPFDPTADIRDSAAVKFCRSLGLEDNDVDWDGSAKFQWTELLVLAWRLRDKHAVRDTLLSAIRDARSS